MNKKQKAVFIDKDGTLIPDIPYNVDAGQITLSEGAIEGLKQLQQAGFLLVIISNQSGVARGYFPEDALTAVQQKIETLLAENEVHLDGFYFCPHHPQGTVAAYVMECACRKPQPGLLLKAAHDLHIDLIQSWMIGDTPADVEAGKRAGCRTVLLLKEQEAQKRRPACEPDILIHNISGAAEQILRLS